MNFRNFLNAVKQNDIKEVKKYLSNKDFNPAQLDSIAIESAIQHDSFDTFILLINDKRLDPSAMDNNSLFCAIQSESINFFKELIKINKVIKKLNIEWIENTFCAFENKNKMKETLIDILNIKNF
tara:strand:+ start:10474 stop:10848 length:375 start_codon:yes stop_codon:yes gene_type:complete